MEIEEKKEEEEEDEKTGGKGGNSGDWKFLMQVLNRDEPGKRMPGVTSTFLPLPPPLLLLHQ